MGPMPNRVKQIAINSFLIFHIVAIVCWAVPVDSSLVALVKSLVRPYMVWSGLFQSWDMFAPAPKSVNTYVEAIVLYRDGNTRNWTMPRMEQLSFTDRYFLERYRKFSENLKEDANAALWPDAARYIARLNNNRSSPENMIMLVRYWSEIISSEGLYKPSPWNQHIFYDYKVKPEDLK